MDAAVPARERSMDDDERQQFRQDREQLAETLADLQQQFQAAATELNQLQAGLSAEDSAAAERRLTIWLGSLLRLVQRSILVQARARLETVTIDTVELKSRDAFDIALANRLDFMNARASLVDSWRLIQVNADALQSVLNVTAGGNLRTARNNPVSFRAPTANLHMGFEFDAPFTRLLERNAYRESLINYQQSRRGFIQSCDALHLGAPPVAARDRATSREPRNSTPRCRDRDSARRYDAGLTLRARRTSPAWTTPGCNSGRRRRSTCCQRSRPCGIRKTRS